MLDLFQRSATLV